MPRIVGPGSRALRLGTVALLVILFAFTPISRALLASVDGSFAPAPFTSLALATPSDEPGGFEVGELVPVRLTNRTGSVKTYHWSATQKGVTISLGEVTLPNGHGANIDVSTTYAAAGKLTIAVSGTNIFVTVSIFKL